MNPLPFGKLPPYRPRRFVPLQIDLGDWAQIAPLFDQLESRAGQCGSLAEFGQWLLDWGELSAAIDEESSRRYIAMTCHTEDAEVERVYLHFVEKIDPQLKPRQFALAKLYAGHPLRTQLPRERYEMFDRDAQVTVELFRPENVALETEEAKLGQQYQKLTGSLTVQFRGEEKTLVQMARYLEEPDRALRQETWELVANRRLQERESFEDAYDSLLKLRQQIASNAGFPSYLDYVFRQRRRFDYSPADCEVFHEAVEQEVLPVVRELQAARRSQLDLPALRPWDLAVDPLQRPPLRPFQTADALAEGAQRIFDQLDTGLGGDFRLMREKQLLDLDNRKGKAPGGYQNNLNECRLPFIFMNAVGVQRDVETLLHEGGHAFHALATKNEDLFAYRANVPLEFAEVASMSMELLGNEHLDVFYDPADAQRARRVHLETIAVLLPWVATVDAFQHWIYTHSGHSRSERSEAWLKLMDRFGGEVDWSGYETARANLWHRQLHIFLSPLYYIEYGIAQLGALQVWANARRDRPSTLQAYRRALALGGSRPLPELFGATGCRFEFTATTIRPLMNLIRDELHQLD
jgi:oligoendopeptidase F